MSKLTDRLKSKMRKKFYDKLSSKESAYNSVLLTTEKYDSIVADIKRIKALKTLVSPPDYRLIEKYDILHVRGRDKLIKPKTPSEKYPKIYVHSDELFDILYATHTSVGHVGRDKMLEEIRLHYKNITKAHLKMFLDLCDSCRPGASRKITPKFNSKSQVCFIDFETRSNDCHKCVLVYRENLTQFLLLKPMVSLSTTDVTDKLLDIFFMIGTPSTLYMHSKKDLFNGVFDSLRPMWPKLKMIHGHPKQSGHINYSNIHKNNQEIESQLASWMTNNKTKKLNEGLRLIQYMNNTTFNSAVGKTPYEAVFKSRVDVKMNPNDQQLAMFGVIEYDQNGKKVDIRNEPCNSSESSFEDDTSDDEMDTDGDSVSKNLKDPLCLSP